LHRASVNVGGLIATTHSIGTTTSWRELQLQPQWRNRHIDNEGTLTASLGGYIALLAPQVRNNGVIVAQLGTVVLAAGETYQLQFDANHTLANILVTPATIAELVQNGNAVHAPGGLIILSAQAVNSLQGSVVNSGGLLEATGLTNNGGVIRLEGGKGQTTIAGTLECVFDHCKGGQVVATGSKCRLTTVQKFTQPVRRWRHHQYRWRLARWGVLRKPQMSMFHPLPRWMQARPTRVTAAQSAFGPTSRMLLQPRRCMALYWLRAA